MPSTHPTPGAGRLRAADCSLAEFRSIVETTTDPAAYPHAGGVEANALVYDGDDVRAAIATPAGRAEVESELARAFLEGPGIAVFQRAFEDPSVVDQASDAFRSMIADQRARGVASGDHFAKPGANDRVWNALEKLALLDPDAFVAYYGNEIIELAAKSWLGPHFQITSQVNVVNPGGEAQEPHRDYHLGFQSDATAEQYPAHVHRLSAALTLQGAVAHVDMPVESGPTLYLPHSQKYEGGYLAWRRPDFKEYFQTHHMQIPLLRGDAVFFNPALFHAAGSNHSTDIERMANLLQVSSAFGRAMESVDRRAMSNAVYRALVRAVASGAPPARIANAIAATAEGYAFPTNLDRDPPIDGLAPVSQADLLRRAVAESWPPARLAEELADHSARRTT